MSSTLMGLAMPHEFERLGPLATRPPIARLALFAVCFVGCVASPAAIDTGRGERQNPRQFKDVDDQKLGQAANDPTASLMSLEIADSYTANFHGLSGEDANSVALRMTLPFQVGSTKHVLGAGTPLATDNPVTGSGFSDTVLFDLFLFEGERRRWGIGPVVLIPTGGSERGAEKWSIGPALGYTRKTDDFLFGVFTLNLLPVAGEDDRDDVSRSIVRPILNYQLGDKWALGVSEMDFNWDWETDRWSSLPLGVRLSKLIPLRGDNALQFNIEYEHDFADDAIGPKDTLRFSAKLLLPR